MSGSSIHTRSDFNFPSVTAADAARSTRRQQRRPLPQPPRDEQQQRRRSQSPGQPPRQFHQQQPEVDRPRILRPQPADARAEHDERQQRQERLHHPITGGHSHQSTV
jgi:hypothetical protein